MRYAWIILLSFIVVSCGEASSSDQTATPPTGHKSTQTTGRNVTYAAREVQRAFRSIGFRSEIVRFAITPPHPCKNEKGHFGSMCSSFIHRTGPGPLPIALVQPRQASSTVYANFTVYVYRSVVAAERVEAGPSTRDLLGRKQSTLRKANLIVLYPSTQPIPPAASSGLAKLPARGG